MGNGECCGGVWACINKKTKQQNSGRRDITYNRTRDRIHLCVFICKALDGVNVPMRGNQYVVTCHGSRGVNVITSQSGRRVGTTSQKRGFGGVAIVAGPQSFGVSANSIRKDIIVQRRSDSRGARRGIRKGRCEFHHKSIRKDMI